MAGNNENNGNNGNEKYYAQRGSNYSEYSPKWPTCIPLFPIFTDLPVLSDYDKYYAGLVSRMNGAGVQNVRITRFPVL